MVNSLGKKGRFMAFLTCITTGNCSKCFSALGDDAVAHENEGEFHPIHRKCLEIWIRAEQKRDQLPICHDCGIPVESIETKENGLIRLSEDGDLSSVKALLGKRRVYRTHDSAFLQASEAGHHRVVEAFLQNGGIAKSLRGRALQTASRYGHYEVVKVLLKNGLFSPESLEVSKRIADERGYQNIVKRLKFC
jgi:hypothetical protein